MQRGASLKIDEMKRDGLIDFSKGGNRIVQWSSILDRK